MSSTAIPQSNLDAVLADEYGVLEKEMEAIKLKMNKNRQTKKLIDDSLEKITIGEIVSFYTKEQSTSVYYMYIPTKKLQSTHLKILNIPTNIQYIGVLYVLNMIRSEIKKVDVFQNIDLVKNQIKRNLITNTRDWKVNDHISIVDNDQLWLDLHINLAKNRDEFINNIVAP
jgi:hypothetical protein